VKKLIQIILLGTVAIVSGCLSNEKKSDVMPNWSFNPEMIFPLDRSLNRPEDGVALQGGRVVVADQVAGLRIIYSDGSSRPFGKFEEAGYLHAPPEIVGGPNGVVLIPSGTHILVADVFRGGLYKVDIASEATELIYQHQFGINMAREDSSGGIWFTQSTRNEPKHGERDLFRAVDISTPDGALYYLPPPKGGTSNVAIKLIGGLRFANGLVLDETDGHLYLAETMGGRVLRYRLDIQAGKVTEQTVILENILPDNLELDRHNKLWIASPVRNEIVVLDLATRTVESVFRISTPESDQLIQEIESRIREGKSCLGLFLPTLWEPGPGEITGMVLSQDDGPVYVTGLGNALIKLNR
jgi:sugar lactone lactonase YvrE